MGNNAIVGISNCKKLKTLCMDRIDLVTTNQLNQLFDNLLEYVFNFIKKIFFLI